MKSHAASVATEAAAPALLPDIGLTNADASARLALDGYNEFPTAKPRRLFVIAADVAREPMFLLLMACGALYLLLGDKGEAAMLLAFVFVIIAITFVRERKSERALEAPRDLSSPRALVIREVEQKRIAGREVVLGHLLVLAEGERVAADALVCRATNLPVDESLLTGESVPVGKIATTEPVKRVGAPGGDSTSFVFSGSLAHREESRVDAPRTRARDAGGGYRALRRQDRDADAKPDDAGQPACLGEGTRYPGPRLRVAGAFPCAPRVCDAREPARSIRPDGQGNQDGDRTAPRWHRTRPSRLDARR